MPTKFLGISLPEELYNKTERERKDLPRSYFYKKLIEFAYKNGGYSFDEW